MKKSWVLIIALSLSAVGLADEVFNSQTVTAGLYCSQLKGCGGDAGCSISGSASGCTITCSDNTAVSCLKGLEEEE
jgi:hypothetical protein